jgi:type I restriction enzyme, S subunit
MQTAQRSYLQFVAYPNLINWSTRYLIGRDSGYNKSYPFKSLSSFLKKSRDAVIIHDDIEYKRVTVKIKGGGVYLRDKEIGKNIGTKRQFLAKAGQFIISKIDARNGAMGVIPELLEGAIVTNDFPLFDIDASVINPEYLKLITSTEAFIKIAHSSSSGTTNRQRVDVDNLLQHKIPLPALEEQEKLVTDYNKKIKEAEQLILKENNLEKEIEKYFRRELGINENNTIRLKKGLGLIEYSSLTKWSLNHLYRSDDYDFTTSKYKTEKVKNLLKLFEGGKTPSKSIPDYWNGNIFWTSPKDFCGQYMLIKSEDKVSELAVKETGIKVYPKGVFLSVFRSGILQHSFPTVITEIETAINQDLKAYTFDKSIVNDFYYLYFVRVFQQYFLNQASKKSVTVESINTEDFFEILIPLPPINKQEKIALHLKEINAEIESLKYKSEFLKQQAKKVFEQAIFS